MKYADILRAMADERPVQYRDNCTAWTDWDIKHLAAITPLSHPDYEWRIKPPNVVVPYYLYGNWNSNGLYLYGSKDHSLPNFNVTFEEGTGAVIKIEGIK